MSLYDTFVDRRDIQHWDSVVFEFDPGLVMVLRCHLCVSHQSEMISLEGNGQLFTVLPELKALVQIQQLFIQPKKV